MGEVGFRRFRIKPTRPPSLRSRRREKTSGSNRSVTGGCYTWLRCSTNPQRGLISTYLTATLRIRSNAMRTTTLLSLGLLPWPQLVRRRLDRSAIEGKLEFYPRTLGTQATVSRLRGTLE